MQLVEFEIKDAVAVEVFESEFYCSDQRELFTSLESNKLE